jgi:2-phospho-L-lactate guanylyltransferase
LAPALFPAPANGYIATMTTWIVTPIKAPEACKTRLSGAMTDAARRDLVREMLRHVVEAARATPRVEVRILGPSRHGLTADIPLLADPGGGLNAALAAAAQAAGAAGATRLVVVAADLPRLTRSDLQALVSVKGEALAVAPDRGESGTNALSLPLPTARAFRFQYGPDSFARHCAEAARLGLPLQVIRSETLGLDIDQPEDLAAI